MDDHIDGIFANRQDAIQRVHDLVSQFRWEKKAIQDNPESYVIQSGENKSVEMDHFVLK